MKTLIVDDVKLSRHGLHELLNSYYPECEVIGSVPSIELAKKILSEQKVQLIFLDVQLSDGLGFEVLESVDSDTKVVMLTAYENYAIESIRKGAFDYLLKPLDVQELQNCIQRIKEETQLENSVFDLINTQPIEGRIGIVDSDGINFIDTSEIHFLKAQGKYTEIHTSQGNYLSSKNLKQFEQILTQGTFMRIHHSFVVNLEYIKKYKREDNSLILKNNIELPVSKPRKELLTKRIITI